MQEAELELQAVIGFKGTVPQGLILHPDNEHLIFPLGCTVVLRNLLKKTQSFLQGHDNQVNCITVSRSGKLLASGQRTFMGFPADVIIWDFEGRQEIHRLSLHKVAVTSLSFSSDETYLATLGGQDDNSLVVWDVASGVAICGTPAATDTAHCVSFFNNTSFSLVTGGNYHVIVWQFDLANKKLRPTQVNLGQFKRVTTNVCLNDDDTFVYCGTTTGDLLEVSLDRALFKRQAPKKCFSLGITCSARLPDGDILVGTGDGTIARIQAGTLKVRASCAVLGGVTSIALTRDCTHFFCGTSHSNIYWVDADTLTAELRNTCHHERINAICFPSGYSEVFATCSVTDIRVWNASTRQELLRIQVPNMECYCLDFMKDGRSIVSGWSDGKVRAFLPQSGKLLYVINDAHKNGVTAMAVSNDCGRIVTGGMEGEVRVWRIGRQTQTMDASLKEHRGRVWCIRIRADDSQAVSASSDGSCIIWDLSTKTRSLCLFESTMFKSIVYHPDESQLLTTGSDRKVGYWDTFARPLSNLYVWCRSDAILFAASLAMAMQENPAPGPVEGRRGTCRICFEDDGDLIQPCLCKGSSQWVHRGCLNHWRAMGLSKDSMTRCPSCKYNYRLKFQRVHAQDDDLSLRKRRFFQNLATQGCSAFIAVQIAIICLGMVIRAADPNEVLVQVFGFPQDPGQDQPGDFMNALHHHKLTYYTAGTIAFVACLGLGGVYYYLLECCCGRSGARHAGAALDCTCRDCGDCCLMCQFCDCGDVCPATCPQFGGPAAVPDHPAVMVILLGVLVALIVIGLVMILVAGVACVQRAVQQYARLQQMRVLTEEYIVEDLASPFDLGEGSADGAAKQMEAEITEVMTGEPAPQRATLETTIYGTERV